MGAKTTISRGKGPYNLGNYILIQKGDIYVLMGHLQRNSIRVLPGALVKAGDAIALVGNSGWTSQPQIHIQAMKASEDSFWKGEGIPIAFDGSKPYKNKLFFE